MLAQEAETPIRAQEIGRLYRRAREGAVETVKLLVECGKQLRKQKDSLEHGEWLPWLEANKKALGFGERTAQLLIGAANTKSTSFLKDESLAAAFQKEIWGNTSRNGKSAATKISTPVANVPAPKECPWPSETEMAKSWVFPTFMNTIQEMSRTLKMKEVDKNELKDKIVEAIGKVKSCGYPIRNSRIHRGLKKLKGGIMQITCERVTVKPKVFDSGDEAWGVFSNNKWVDVFGLDHKPEKGETLDIDLKTTTKNGRTFYNGRVKPSEKQVEKAKEVLKPVITATKLYPPPEPESKPFTQLTNVLPVNNIRTTSYTHPLNDYERLINRGFELAGINGVTDDAARVSLVAILCIAYGDGKLSIDDLESFPAEAIEAGNRILANDDGWGDRDWTDGPPEDEVRAEVDKHNAEMEAAKARMDKFVAKRTPGEGDVKPLPFSDTTDYQTQLGAAIKTYCFNKKLDFKTNKFEVLWKCAETRNLESLSQAEAKIAIEQLKVMP